MSDEVKEKPVTPEAKPTTATGPKNIDWKAAFKFYCTNTEDGKQHTYKDVAEKYEVAERTVEDYGSKNEWVRSREDIGKRGLEKFKKSKADQIGEAEDKHLKTWRGVQQTANELLKELRKDILAQKLFETALVEKLTDSEIKPGDKDAIKALEIEVELTYRRPFNKNNPATRLSRIVSTLETSISGERLVLGLPNNVTKGEFTSKVTELTPEMTAEMDAMMKKDADPTDTKVS